MMNFFLKREFVIKELNTGPVAPFVATVLSTKCGVTKSTNAANISAFCADHGVKKRKIS